MGICEGRIDKAFDLRVGLRQIDFYIAALDRHGRPDGDIFIAAPVIIQQSHAVIDAVLPSFDDGTRLFFRRIQNALLGGRHRFRTELGNQLPKSALTQLHRTDLRGQIAFEITRMPDVYR